MIEKRFPFLFDPDWRKKLHKYWFWGELNQRVLVWDDGTLSYIEPNEFFIEKPKNLLGEIYCPGWNNLDTSIYEDGVGIYDDEEEKWNWDPKFLENYPEYANIEPTWENIINASIETGDWSVWEEELVSMIIDQIEREGKI